MNPSISGWINKYYSEKSDYIIFSENNSTDLIKQIRNIGFSYGIIDKATLPSIYNQFDYTQEELSKICFLQILEVIYQKQNTNATTESFLESITSFYELISPPKASIMDFLFKDKNLYTRLENILTSRWKEHFFSQSKSNDFILNMLLFYADALSYEVYLTNQPTSTSDTFTSTLINELVDIINYFKQDNQESEDQNLSLILFLKKVTYADNICFKTDEPSELETCFVIDFLVCNAWNNNTKELNLPDFSKALKRVIATDYLVNESKESFLLFVAKRNNDYAFFRTTNLFKNIMNNSSKYIEVILTRNKKRLINELSKNTQLMKLLADSTYRDLNTEEKKMVKNQTIEVLKTIPSLAIFILPGGSLVLPIILKLIPSLLPSSFNENNKES